MSESEPPSNSCPLFMVGKNSRGNWVVQDQKGLRGGLFVNRAQAVKFAIFENGNRRDAVVMVPGVLELNLEGKPSVQDRCSPHVQLARAA